MATEKKYWGTKIICKVGGNEYALYTKSAEFAKTVKFALKNRGWEVELEPFSKPEPKK